jgi:hypothetical protein
MKDEHFDKLKKIGICYWEGELKGYLIKLLNHNSQYLDELILVLGEGSKVDRESLSSKINIMEFSREGLVKRCLGDNVPSEVLNKLISSTSAMMSDLLCYTSNFFLNNYYERVMYFDLNTLLWNPFMINELFSVNKFPKTSKIRMFEEEGVYLSNGFKSYLSSDFSIVDKECDLREVIVNFIRDNAQLTNYCLLGPIFLAWLYSLRFANPRYDVIEILPIEPNSLDPLNISRVTELKHKPHSIGVTMSNTQYKSIGYAIDDIMIYDDNTCKVYFKQYNQE